jgi:hypothetical protein
VDGCAVGGEGAERETVTDRAGEKLPPASRSPVAAKWLVRLMPPVAAKGAVEAGNRIVARIELV